jgi:hypothetical protein
VLLREQNAQLDLNEYLGIDGDEDQPDKRLLPWKEELDDYMFYL